MFDFSTDAQREVGSLKKVTVGIEQRQKIDNSRTFLPWAACNLDLYPRSSILHDFTSMKDVVEDIGKGEGRDRYSRKATVNFSCIKRPILWQMKITTCLLPYSRK